MNIKNCVKVFWISWLFLVAGPCIGSDDNKVDFTDPAKSIIIECSKPVFTITLKSNPTTGYSWALKSYDTNLISPVSCKFFPPADKKLMGAPGYEKWTFRVKPAGFVVPHTTNITLVYARAWEEQGAQLTNFKVVTSHAN